MLSGGKSIRRTKSCPSHRFARVETADGGGRSGADDEQPAGIAARHGQQTIADLGRGLPARGGSEPIEIIDQQRAIKRRLNTVTRRAFSTSSDGP